MEFQDKVNAILIPMTHYFAVFRMPELAVANILALMTMNLSNQRDKYFLLMNGIFTYLMGYIFFLEQKPSSGVYMFLLGMVCIGTSMAGQFQLVLEDWNSRFRVTKEVVYDESDDEDDKEEEETAAPSEQPQEIPPLEASVESDETHPKTE